MFDKMPRGWLNIISVGSSEFAHMYVISEIKYDYECNGSAYCKKNIENMRYGTLLKAKKCAMNLWHNTKELGSDRTIVIMQVPIKINGKFVKI